MTLCHLEKPIPADILEIITTPKIAIHIVRSCDLCAATAHCPTYITCKKSLVGQIEQGDAELENLEEIVGQRAFRVITGE